MRERGCDRLRRLLESTRTPWLALRSLAKHVLLHSRRGQSLRTEPSGQQRGGRAPAAKVCAKKIAFRISMRTLFPQL